MESVKERMYENCFHIFYNAVSKIDHYIVSLPPNTGAVVSDQMAFDLARAATKNSDGLLSAKIAVSQLLNKALAMAPDNGDYHYGLGWVCLLKGESAKAMEYIRSAADLGNPDALKYLIKHPAAAK